MIPPKPFPSSSIFEIKNEEEERRKKERRKKKRRREKKIVDMIFLYIDGLVSPLRVQYPLPDARQVQATN